MLVRQVGMDVKVGLSRNSRKSSQNCNMSVIIIVRIETKIKYIIKGIDEIIVEVNNTNHKGCATA